MDADALAYYCDCSKEEQVKEVARQVVEEIGEIDILVNNAGILNGRSIVMLTEKEIRKSIEINLLAHFWVRVFHFCKNFRSSLSALYSVLNVS